MTQAILHITNGDSAANLIRCCGLPGDVLPWRDVLHAGPVPCGLDLSGLSQVRAEFIHACGWGELADIVSDFRQRDQRLARCLRDSAVVLWFEHDLYDQLQLIQLLEWFSWPNQEHPGLYLIQAEDYLGTMTPQRILSLWDTRQRVCKGQLALGNDAWNAFRSPTPEPWVALLARDTMALPFLKGAVVRQLEEYPGAGNGLTRTEVQILSCVERGVDGFRELFEACQEVEDRRFMGDASFRMILNDLCAGRAPALERWTDAGSHKSQHFVITHTGKRLLNGALDMLQWRHLDRWVGGVHLTDGQCWRWDRDNKSLMRDSGKAAMGTQ